MFKPKFQISPKMAKSLMQIESLKESIIHLPITPSVLLSLRETAKLKSTHFSTMIEGNRLTQNEVNLTIKKSKRIQDRKRDEKEVKGYFIALEIVEKIAKQQNQINEKDIKLLHALVMGGGKKGVKPSAYRDGQNVIRDSRTNAIVYLPPEAKDVAILIKDLIAWIEKSIKNFPIPIVAAIAHYQFAAIHPYYDGNGRTARLLATLIMHIWKYDLKGLYSLDEYYAENLSGYYEGLNVGPSHNYYLGREKADISKWVEYFLEGMAYSFNRIKEQAKKSSIKGLQDKSKLLNQLDARKRIILTFFQANTNLTSKDVEEFCKLQPRSARALCEKWVEESFINISDLSKKNRKYQLASKYKKYLD